MGLSLHELLMTGGLGMGAVFLISLLIGFLVGMPILIACIGTLLGFFISVRAFPKMLSRLKAGKPSGFLKKLLVIKASTWGFVKPPYLKYQGKWRKEQRIGVKNNV